jgi:hypothetical protein
MTPTIEEQVTALHTLDVPALAAKHLELFGKPPRFANRVLLWRTLAWEMQRRHYGGLSAKARARLERLVAEIQFPTEPPAKVVRAAVPQRPRAPDAPLPGTTIVRTWHGRELRVRVVERGFEYEGKLYRSLSGVAREITGTGWNGPAFFGLREPKGATRPAPEAAP